MSRFELLTLAAAILAASGRRSIAGAIAAAGQLLDEVREAEPDAAAAHDRARAAAAWRAGRDS